MSTAAPPAAKVPLPTLAPERPGGRIDYELFLDCVHCGLCTSACPTYVELGTEMDSPRGRIYLMRAVTDGTLPLDGTVRHHLDLCLDCRACESACPSGVQYGRLIEPFRADMQKLGAPASETGGMPWWQRFVLFHVFPYVKRANWALIPARMMQTLGLDRWLEKSGLMNLLPERVRQMQAILPRLKPRGREIPELLPAIGPRRARVALFTGCVADAIFHDTNWITARVLQLNGCEVWTPRNQVCCGALHLHSGLEDSAQVFANSNCEVFLGGPTIRNPQSAIRNDIDAIVINVAGCGSTLKEYHHLLHGTDAAEAGTQFVRKVRDVSEFLMELGPVPPRYSLNLRATYHDACHLCHAQQIRKQPRQLLEMIPGLQLVPLNESEICCGAAGSYNLSQPEMAERLGRRKAENVLATKPQAVFTANAGCIMQIAKHLRTEAPDVWVAHPIEALWAAYVGKRK